MEQNPKQYLSTLLPGCTYRAGSATCIQTLIRPSCNLVALNASSSYRKTNTIQD